MHSTCTDTPLSHTHHTLHTFIHFKWTLTRLDSFVLVSSTGCCLPSTISSWASVSSRCHKLVCQLWGFTSALIQPLRRRCIGQKLRPWKRRRCIRVGASSWGLPMWFKGRKDAEFWASWTSEFAKKTLVFDATSALGLLLSEDFEAKMYFFLSKASMRRSHRLSYQHHITYHIFTSCNVHICACFFCTNYPKPIEILPVLCYYCWWFRNPIPNHLTCIPNPANKGFQLPTSTGGTAGFLKHQQCRFAFMKPRKLEVHQLRSRLKEVGAGGHCPFF